MTTVYIEIPSSSTVIVVKRNLVSLKIVENKNEKAILDNLVVLCYFWQVYLNK